MRQELVRHGGVAVEAAGRLARHATPGKRSRALTLADHEDALCSIQCGAVSALTAPALGVLANTANLIGLALAGRGRADPWFSPVDGVHSLLWSALKEASSTDLLADARVALRSEVMRCEEAKGTPLANMAERSPGRNLVRRAAEATGAALGELGGAVSSHRAALGYRVSPPGLLADVAAVVEPVLTVLTYLESALGHEAILIDWLYEEASGERRAEKVSGRLLETQRRLAGARTRLQVVFVVVRDVSDEDER